MAQPQHVPVLVGRVTALLAPALAGPGAVLVDATLGRAGHARALLDACPGLLLIGVDADLAAIEAARDLLAPYADRVTLVHARYDQIPAIVSGDPRGSGRKGFPPGSGGFRRVAPPGEHRPFGPAPIMGLLFDLGVSSPQLDDPARGFAYAQDAPLDMRMDRTAERTAADIVNGYPAAELARVLREYGEERFARRIADALVRERAREPITSTQRLSAIVKDAIPAATRRTGGNPAKRTFQALRIEVNDELGTLRRALPAALGVLAVGGRVVVLAYHSLEDRIVKRELVRLSADQTPPGLPVTARAAAPQFRLLTRGAERPDSEEVAGNPRAASARLRAAERIREAA
ncbi:MAG TPA: 16S rRNA (cytosine(1402)-N(4))-methyltransferase RsmH [Streptosporangiaceae bacterium]|nr:16S rRNA (cytosine(1402)-N(4))-methyltransferase RsmH [Streptosporangiaceae bacterium]